MLYNEVLNLIEISGIIKLSIIEQTLDIDKVSLEIVIDKLLKTSKIERVFLQNSCCTSKSNCSSCPISKDGNFYIVSKTKNH